MARAGGAFVSAAIQAGQDGTCELTYRNETKTLTLKAGETHSFMP